MMQIAAEDPRAFKVLSAYPYRRNDRDQRRFGHSVTTIVISKRLKTN